jgi:acrylyl-CoA reductase (NADPH)
MVNAELQGRTGDHRPRAGGAPLPDDPWHRLAGTVVDSRHRGWKVGDRVLLNGWGVGETHCGEAGRDGAGQGRLAVALPAEFSARQAMAIGTAGIPRCCA